MYFPYMQVHHAVRAQSEGVWWMQSPAPIFHYMTEVSQYKGFILRCYSMLLSMHLKGFPPKATLEKYVGTFEEEQWEEALLAVKLCSLKVAQRLAQLYIVLQVHLTPARLYRIGVRVSSECTRCSKDHGDLIHLLWHCSKLHLYWMGVVNTINRVFQVNIQRNPKPCLLGILDDLPIEDFPKQSIARALFQAHKLILRHWKATEPPALREWIA